MDQRYPNADELLYDLEHYIYHKGYGPTNETLGKFIRELFDQSKHLDQQQNKPLRLWKKHRLCAARQVNASDEQKSERGIRFRIARHMKKSPTKQIPAQSSLA